LSFSDPYAGRGIVKDIVILDKPGNLPLVRLLSRVMIIIQQLRPEIIVYRARIKPGTKTDSSKVPEFWNKFELFLKIARKLRRFKPWISFFVALSAVIASFQNIGIMTDKVSKGFGVIGVASALAALAIFIIDKIVEGVDRQLRKRRIALMGGEEERTQILRGLMVYGLNMMVKGFRRMVSRRRDVSSDQDSIDSIVMEKATPV
jgi:hypothetical protein